jgi:hypothetical protein
MHEDPRCCITAYPAPAPNLRGRDGVYH